MRQVLLFLTVFFALAAPALAIEEFLAEFERLYVQASPTTPTARRFREKFRDTKCLVCHVGEDKEDRNIYGGYLAQNLDRKRDKFNSAYIQSVLKAAEGLHSDPAQPRSYTFGQLLKAGYLPTEKP